jgi:hypothetical protein
LDVNYDLGLTQLLGQPLVGTLQLLILFGEGMSFGFRPPRPWLKPLPNAGGSFTPPLPQMRRVQTFAAQKGADAAELGSRVRLCQDLLLVVGREPPAFGFRHDLGIGMDGRRRLNAGFTVRCTSFGLASLVLTTSSGRQSRRRQRWNWILHLGFSFRPEH